MLLFIATFVGLTAFTPVDALRLHLMGKPATLVSSMGLVLVAVSWRIVYLTLKQNAFAAPVVKHQEDRHQSVIDTGVYGVVRHPMYAGAALLLVGMPLWLESYPAALLASLPIGVLAVRILFEEKFLRQVLKGYDAYAEKVRYRLIPGLW